MKILFLYTELAGYVMSCFKALAEKDIEVHVVSWPVNKEAPFEFEIPKGVTIYKRSDYNNTQLLNLTKSIKPDKIICSGWIDKGYMKVCKSNKNKIPTILTLDNHWLGNLKQQIMRLFGSIYLKFYFSHAWVPGKPQLQYAKKLGYGKKTLTGFYSADTMSFEKIFHVKKDKDIPKRFLYVGRYIPQKGLNLLFSAFMELQEENPSSWELWCLGAGEQYVQRPEHPKIKHHGFVQPSKMFDFLTNTGVFVLPSRFEPWGVVVHEMAVAGFPMICSSAIGAATQFLKNNINGYSFENENKENLKKALKKIMNLDKESLSKMSKNSHKFGIVHTPAKWAETAIAIGY